VATPSLSFKDAMRCPIHVGDIEVFAQVLLAALRARVKRGAETIKAAAIVRVRIRSVPSDPWIRTIHPLGRKELGTRK
jgi:hypothetical protein